MLIDVIGVIELDFNWSVSKEVIGLLLVLLDEAQAFLFGNLL